MNRIVTLYGHRTCPVVHRVAWALAERGIDHGTVEVRPMERDELPSQELFDG